MDVNELKSMTREEIREFFEFSKTNKEDIIKLMNSLGFRLKSKVSRKTVIEFAAVQLSSLGALETLAKWLQN